MSLKMKVGFDYFGLLPNMPIGDHYYTRQLLEELRWFLKTPFRSGGVVPYPESVHVNRS